MSKIMSNEQRAKAIDDLMDRVKRNTQGSSCITVFEGLLREINNVGEIEYVDSIIKSMNRFADEFARICKAVDLLKNYQSSETETSDTKIPYKDIIANMLSREFILNKNFFSDTKKKANIYMAYYTLLERGYVDGYSPKDKILLPNKNFIGKLNEYTYDEAERKLSPFGLVSLDAMSEDDDDLNKVNDTCRKAVLLYNYLPAIVKAFIQTKRRSLDLDKNSKKFE